MGSVATQDHHIKNDAACLIQQMIGQTVSQYKILSRLGTGGMGTVYEARDTKLDRLVALKFLRTHVGRKETAIKRFINEAKAASALDHPNICTIYNIDEAEDGQMFIAMAHYPGQSLRERIEEVKSTATTPFPIDKAIRHSLQIARGLRMAHEHQIVHRDIKPANIMLTSNDTVKIVDFGLAKLEGASQITKEGATMGTVAYMSPEQARGIDVGHRTDIWALAVLLYEMIGGRRPFTGESDQAIIYAILNQEPPPLSTLRKEVPRSLDEIVCRGLAKDQAKRYDSIAPMIRDLEDVSCSEGASTISMGLAKPLSESPTPQKTIRKIERRHATVVVSNLVGYLDILEQLSPDALENMVSQLKETVTETVAHHGGVLNEFREEAFVMLFGIPEIHEDDSVRAGRMALELHARIQEFQIGNESLQLSTGISAGPVVARVSHHADRSFEVTGKPPQIAGHLASVADPNEILFSRDGKRFDVPGLDAEASPSISLSGGSLEITPYRILGVSKVRTRFDRANQASLTPYTGRENELTTLKDSLQEVINGEGRLVTVVGEAGVGKSRLLHEFQQLAEGESVDILVGRCQADTFATPYRPFIGMLTGMLGLDDRRETADLSQSVLSQIEQIDESLVDFIPLYLDLLSIKNDAYASSEHLKGDEFKIAMSDALTALLTLKTKRGPSILFLEDWHWADPASEEVLGQLDEVLRPYPLLVVVTYRSEYSEKWRRLAHHPSLQLGPVTASSALSIIKSVLNIDELPNYLGDRLIEKTGGNPFFLEELSRNLIEQDLLHVVDGQAQMSESFKNLRLPDTVQAIIQTRLGRLSPEAKEVLLLGAVVGGTFSRNVLQHAMGDTGKLRQSLDQLKALGFIEQISVAPEAVYKFKHMLTQEGAYDCLLLHQQKSMHGTVGLAIETLHSQRIDKYIAPLAHHFSQAEDWLKAARYGRLTAKKAIRLSQFGEALNRLDQAQAWVMKLPAETDRSTELSENLYLQERICETLGDRERQQRIIDELLALFNATENQTGLLAVYRRQGELYTLLGRFDAADQVLQESLRLSKTLSNPAEERRTLRSLGFLNWQCGSMETAIANNERALAISRDRKEDLAIAVDLTNFGNVLRHEGNLERAQECLDEALEIFTHLSEKPEEVAAMHIAANIHRDLGDLDKALEIMNEALRISRGNRLLIHQAFHLNAIGHLFLQKGNAEESLALHRDAMELSRKCHYAEGLVHSLRMIAEALIALDRHAEARPYLEEGISLYRQLEAPQSELELWEKIAVLEEHQGSFTASIQAREKMIELSVKTNNRAAELEAREGLARVTRLRGDDLAQVSQRYSEALRTAAREGNTEKQGEFLNVLGIIAWQRSEFDEALAYYEKALEIFRSLNHDAHCGLTMNSIGVTLRKLQRHDEAMQCLEEAYKHHCQTKQIVLQGHALFAMGELHEEQNKLDEALHCFEMSLLIRKKNEDDKGEAWMHYRIARIHSTMANAMLAQNHLDKAVSIGKNQNDTELLDRCRELQNRERKKH